MKTFKEYIDKNWNYDGLSAKCLYGFYTKNIKEYAYPHDPDDLCRVLQAIRIISNPKEVMSNIATYYNRNHWRQLYNHWDELMDIFSTEWDSNRAEKTFEFMQKLYETC